MNWTRKAIFTALAALTATWNSGCASTHAETTPLSSLCVFDENKICWVNRPGGEQRAIQKGDYGISPADLNRIIEKLKSVQ